MAKIASYNPKVTLFNCADKDYVIEGDVVTYRITATNEENLVCNNIMLDHVTISDLLDSGLQFIPYTVTLDGILIDEANILAGVDIGSLAVGQTKVITFQAKIIKSDITPILNVANGKFNFTLPGGILEQRETASNTYEINVFKADLQIVKTADKEEVLLKDILTYKIDIINDGNLIAHNVSLSEELSKQVEFISESFTINGKAVNGVELSKGIIIGNILPGQKTTIYYQVIIVGDNCSGMLINQANVLFDYRLPNGTTGEKAGTGGSDATHISKIKIGITTFKQMSIQFYLGLPEEKPNIEAINTVTGTIDILTHHVIATPQVTNQGGQTLTGHKLIVRGTLNLGIEYTALDLKQTVHSTQYNIPFSTFIILSPDYSRGGKLEVVGVVEDIYYKVIDIRNFFVNTEALVDVKVLYC